MSDRFGWKEIGIICGAIMGLVAVFGVVYKADCYNLRTHGDTIFATDTKLAEAEQEIAAVKASQIYWQLGQEYRDNQQWLWKVESKFPNEAAMPPTLRDQYRKIKLRQEEIKRQQRRMEEG